MTKRVRRPLIEITNNIDKLSDGYMHENIKLDTRVAENRLMVESLKKIIDREQEAVRSTQERFACYKITPGHKNPQRFAAGFCL